MAGSAPSCAIVHHRSPGMAADASLLAAAIRASFPGARIASWALRGRLVKNYKTSVEIGDEARAALPFDFLFLLEHAHGNPPFLDPGFARHVVYVPNVEWLGPLDLEVIASGAIHTVFLKSRYSGVVFSRLPGVDRVRNGTLFTGWTSPDVGAASAAERDWNRLLHVCGKSRQKNGDAIVSLWMRRPDLPDMTIVAGAETSVDLPMPLRAAENLHVLVNKLSEPTLRALQREAGIHVCPSIAEGFGHTLNEARAAAAVLITTDGPPMNEIVEDSSSGILIPVRPENQEPFHLSTGFRVTEDDLEASIRRVLEMTPEQRSQIGFRARHLFEEERKRFHANIREFIANRH
jgi:hypothetical protein